MNTIKTIIIFMFAMWAMIVLAGASVVIISDHLHIIINDGIAATSIQILIFLGVVTVWIFFLSKIKNIIFSKQLF